jgi:hypothetical protein
LWSGCALDYGAICKEGESAKVSRGAKQGVAWVQQRHT